MSFGWRVYGLGIMALGIISLAFRDFDPGQPVPANFPFRSTLVYVAGVFMVVAAAAVQFRRTVAWGSAALGIYYGLFVVVLLDGRQLLSQFASYGIYEEFSMPLAIALAGLIIHAASRGIDAARAAHLTQLCQRVFGACVLIWGGAHFVYMNMTAPLVPEWLPPSQVFWGYTTGICFLAAGLAILTGVKARLAATSLTVMIACFGILANDRMLLNSPSSHFNWSECAVNLALVGAAWVVADSLRRRSAPVQS